MAETRLVMSDPHGRKGDQVKWDKARLILLIIITSVWVANFTASIFVNDYNPDPTIGAVFMLVAGYLYVINKGRNGNE